MLCLPMLCHAMLHVHAHAAGRGRLLDKRSVLRGRGGRVAHDAAVCASAVSLSSLSPSLCGKLRPSILSVRTLRVMAAAFGQLFFLPHMRDLRSPDHAHPNTTRTGDHEGHRGGLAQLLKRAASSPHAHTGQRTRGAGLTARFRLAPAAARSRHAHHRS